MQILKIILTALLSVTALFIITKIMGHKQIAHLNFFDYVTGITIGSIAAELATSIERPLYPLVAMGVWCAVSTIFSLVTSKFPRSRKFINGVPTIIMSGGKLYRKNMKKAKLELSEFMAMCRQEGYFDLSDIHTAVFEYNGRLTVLPKSDKRPLEPYDMNLSPTQETLSVEVIMDGRIMGENLHRMGLDERWIMRHISDKGYKSPREIFLALCDENHELTVFPVE